MNTRKRPNTRTTRTARDVARQEIADAVTVAEALIKQLQDLDGYSAQRPKDWGYAGTGAHVRARLEELYIGLSDIDCDTEEENHREARRATGIALDRDWS